MTRSSFRFDWKFFVGIGISLFFIVLLFAKIDLHQLVSAFRSMDAWYLIPAIILTFVSFFGRAIRWYYLLLPMKRVGMGSLYNATIIGYMANDILPARLGEFVRAFVLGQREGLETTSVFATLVLDRLFDGFTVLLILLVAFFTVRLPAGMSDVQEALLTGGYVTLSLYVLVIVFLVLLKRRTSWTLALTGKCLSPFPARLSEKVIPLLGSFITGLKLSTKPGELSALVGSSLFTWAFAVWPIDLILRSFGIHLPITASMFIMVFLVFAVMVPASPGYVGTYHAACVYGLMAFGIHKERALSVALVIHGVSFFPVIIAGFYCLWRSKLTLRGIGSDAAVNVE